MAVFHAAEESGRNPFVTCVGREDEPCRMRRASFPYDGSYPGEPLPIVTLEFRQVNTRAACKRTSWVLNASSAETF